MAITYKGVPGRARFLAPEDKFKAKKAPPLIPVWNQANPIVEPAIEVIQPVPETDSKPIVINSKPITHDSEPTIEKPKKRGRPKKVKEEKESEMF